MRVTATEDFSFTYGMVPYAVTKGTVISGSAARHLLDSKAPVAEEPEPKAISPDVELDIDGKIDDVLAWVGDDPERALEAHGLEEAKGDKARPRLLSKLAELVDQA